MLIVLAILVLINAAISFLALSCAGNLRIELQNVARSQAMLTVDVANGVLDKLNDRWDADEYKYTYLADCASRCTFALTQDPDYAPLNSAESVAKFADDTFATFDAMHPGFKSYWDNPATEEEAKALKIPMPHSQPQSVFDGAPFGAASSRRPI